MAFAVLVGVILVLGLGLVFAIKAAADARRDLDDLEEEMADARGLGLNLARDPAPELWSSVDFEVLRDDADAVDEHDPYATLTSADSDATWSAAPRPNGSEVQASAVAQPATDVQPFSWQAPADPPMVVLVVGIGFLGAGGAAVTTAARLQVPLHDLHASRQTRSKPDDSDVPPLSSFYDATVVRDEIVRDGLGDAPPASWDERPIGNGPRSGNGSEPERIAWRPPTEVSPRR